MPGDNDKLYAPVHFWTLRTFLDAEYSVLVGYAFYMMADRLIEIHRIARKELGIKLSTEFGTMFNKVYNSPEVLGEIGSFIAIVCVLIMMVDDYARSRIVTYLAPCRSIGRVGLDINIGFFFGLTYWLISIKSALLLLPIAIAFFLGLLWAILVRREAKEWEELDEQKRHETDQEVLKNWAKVEHWPSYLDRLYHIIWSHLTYCGLFLGAFGLHVYLAPNPRYWFRIVVGLIIFLLVSEALRYYTEEKISRLAELYTGKCEFRVLKTVVLVPEFMRLPIRHRARQQAQKRYDNRTTRAST